MVQLSKMVTKSGCVRQKDYCEKNAQARKLSNLKFRVKTVKKREEDPKFDEDCKRKEAERKRKYRERKASESEKRETLANDENDDSVEPEDETPEQMAKRSRQALVGMLQRKRANKEKRASINNLVAENRDMEKEMKHMGESLLEAKTEVEETSLALEKSEAQVAKLKGSLKQNDLWLQSTFKYCSTETKRNFKVSYQIAANAGEIEKGTTSRLLRNTGINFSKQFFEKNDEKSALKKKVDEFAIENSSEMPDMRKQRKNIR